MTLTKVRNEPVFRPRARMILLLGDQLIRDAGLAVFELVKNAYDADASHCTVTMADLSDPAIGKITVQDDGVGMRPETVHEVWLEPGTDYRAVQVKARERTAKRRLPLGEKGVGRFAAHKLGRHIELVTRAVKSPEVVVSIDWELFGSRRYLSDVPVSVKTRTPIVFAGNRTGTRIEVTKLREPWTRGKVRDLYRSVSSICSPFRGRGPDDFTTTLVVKPNDDWLEGLIDIDSVLEYALFRASGTVQGKTVLYNYEFAPLAGMRKQVGPRKIVARKAQLMRPFRKPEPLDISHLGAVAFDLYIFDREPKVLDLITTDKLGLKRFLDENGGVRVYRDGVRVFDFGEPGNDWLDLGGRRVNIPTVRVSNNQVIGAVTLGEKSRDVLIEKTNREGFIENDAYEDLRHAVLYVLTQIETERKIDKDRLRKVYSRGLHREPVVEDIAELRKELQKRANTQELVKYVDRIDKDFTDIRDRLMVAAGAGLTLTTVIHEVEKIIRELLAAMKRGADRDRVQTLVLHLAQMVDGLGFLARNSGFRIEKASNLIHQALFNTEYRLRAHGIQATNGLDQGDPDFSVKCSRRLVVQTLMNLLDNSIYWLENKGSRVKEIYIGTVRDLEGARAIVVADNGPGFANDDPEYLVQPFFTRKPEGIGLGLHLANEVAKLHKGRLVFPDPSELNLPKHFNGAIVAITFSEG